MNHQYTPESVTSTFILTGILSLLKGFIGFSDSTKAADRLEREQTRKTTARTMLLYSGSILTKHPILSITDPPGWQEPQQTNADRILEIAGILVNQPDHLARCKIKHGRELFEHIVHTAAPPEQRLTKEEKLRVEIMKATSIERYTRKHDDIDREIAERQRKQIGSMDPIRSSSSEAITRRRG